MSLGYSKFLASYLEETYTYIVMHTFANYTLKEEFQTELKEIKTKKDEYRDVIEKLFPNIDLHNYSRFLKYQCQNSIIFFYTGLENYLYKCFREILISYPRFLENKEVKIKELLDCDLDVKEIIELKAEREVEQILKNPFYEIFKIAKIKYGINHYIEEADIEIINKYRHIRNIFAHRRGIVDKMFLKKLDHLGYKEGDSVDLTLEMVNEFSLVSSRVAQEFDRAFIEKFPQFLFKI